MKAHSQKGVGGVVVLTAAPCGPVVDFDVTFTTGYAEIDFDPLEWAPDGSVTPTTAERSTEALPTGAPSR